MLLLLERLCFFSLIGIGTRSLAHAKWPPTEPGTSVVLSPKGVWQLRELNSSHFCTGLGKNVTRVNTITSHSWRETLSRKDNCKQLWEEKYFCPVSEDGIKSCPLPSSAIWRKEEGHQLHWDHQVEFHSTRKWKRGWTYICHKGQRTRVSLHWTEQPSLYELFKTIYPVKGIITVFAHKKLRKLKALQKSERELHFYFSECC